jgi:pimeloyl-ACP methyl ester carboxylesterase
LTRLTISKNNFSQKNKSQKNESKEFAMAAWHEGTVETNGIRLHYTRTGDDGMQAEKLPIVLAHGLTSIGSSWSRLAHELEVTYDLIMVDARGHGQSDKPETGYTPQDHMRDLAGVIQALHLERPVVMGHSMGAVTAALVSAEYPELVCATVLEDPVWYWPQPAEISRANRQTAYEQWRKRLELRKMLSTTESYIHSRREHLLWTAEDIDADVASKQAVAVQALEFLLHHDRTWMPQVEKLQSPTLLIYGNPDLGGIVGPDIAAEARRINPLIEPVQIAAAGHEIRRDQYDEYRAVLREFLARVQRGRQIPAGQPL